MNEKKSIKFTVSQEEYNQIKAQAEENKQSMSAFIRNALISQNNSSLSQKGKVLAYRNLQEIIERYPEDKATTENCNLIYRIIKEA